MPNLITPKEAAGILRMNYRKILDMISMGELPAYKIGRDYRISESDLYRFIEKCKVKSIWK